MNKTRWLIVTIFVVFGLLLVACASGTATEAPPAEQPPAEEPPAEEPPAEEPPAEEPPAEEPPAEEPPAEDMEPVTLRVLTWQNPPTVEFVEAFNEKFEAAHPNITVDYSVVNANDIQTVTQTRRPALHVRGRATSLAATRSGWSLDGPDRSALY
jgi:ABC-type glycerol-3-phosphate transport system substrate-binding protein